LRETGHEHFNGSLVIPVVTPAGKYGDMIPIPHRKYGKYGGNTGT
jgi:hypothetical protein